MISLWIPSRAGVSTMFSRTSRKNTHGDVLLWGDIRYRPPNRTDLLPSFTCLPTLRWPGNEREQRSEWTKIQGGTRDFSLFLVFTIQWLAHFDHAQNQLQTNYGSPRFPQTYWKLVCRAKKQKSRVFLFFNSWHDMLAGKNERVSYGYHHMYLLYSTVTISAEGVLSHSYDS